MVVKSGKKIFICVAVSLILIVSLMAFASAASDSDAGFFGKIAAMFKSIFGGKAEVTGHVTDLSWDDPECYALCGGLDCFGCGGVLKCGYDGCGPARSQAECNAAMEMIGALTL